MANDNAAENVDGHEPGPVEPGEGMIQFDYSKQGKMPLFLVAVWTFFFAFMLYYIGTWMIPALIQDTGVR